MKSSSSSTMGKKRPRTTTTMTMNNNNTGGYDETERINNHTSTSSGKNNKSKTNPYPSSATTLTAPNASARGSRLSSSNQRLTTTKDVLRGSRQQQQSRPSRLDEEIDFGSESDDDDDNNEGYFNDNNEDIPNEEQMETADAKRLRLAKEMLSRLAKNVTGSKGTTNTKRVDHLDTTQSGIQEAYEAEQEEEEDYDDEGGGNNTYIHDEISQQLQSQYLLQKGNILRNIADPLKIILWGQDTVILYAHPLSDGKQLATERYRSTNTEALQPYTEIPSETNASSTNLLSSPSVRIFSRRGHELPITALAIAPDGSVCYTASKGCDIFQWSLQYTEGGVCTKAISFPGRRRTKYDVQKQVTLALGGKKGILPVYGTSYGGGRVGSSSSLPTVSGNQNNGGNITNESESMMKIVQHHGQTSQDHSSSITMVNPSSTKLSKKAIAIARSRGIPDYQITGHWDEVLCLAVSPDNHYVASGGRDNTVRLWDIFNYTQPDKNRSSTTTTAASSVLSSPVKNMIKPMETFVGHKDAVTAVTFRPSTGSASTITTTSQGNSSTLRSTTTTSTLYSASYDRMIKIWSIDARSHLDTLFGHQDCILDLTVANPFHNSKENSNSKERCLTVGKDNTARVWKIAEQSQLLFRGHNDTLSLEIIRTIGDGSLFITGGQDGSLCLWSIHRKRPIYTVPYAHGNGLTLPKRDEHREKNTTIVSIAEDAGGHGPPHGLREKMSKITGCHVDDLSSGYCSWITAISVLPNSNVCVTGSGDGYLRFWKLVSSNDTPKSTGNKTVLTNPWSTIQGLQYIGGIPLKGIVTGLEWSNYLGDNDDDSSLTNEKTQNSTQKDKKSSSTRGTAVTNTPKDYYLLATVSQEHRLGRWWTYKGTKNNIVMVKITL